MIYLAVNLRDQIEYYHYLTREQEIEATKRSNSILYEARRNAKIDKCLICGRAMNSFCNSHTVPQFSLRKISPDGIVLNFNSLLESPAMEFFMLYVTIVTIKFFRNMKIQIIIKKKVCRRK